MREADDKVTRKASKGYATFPVAATFYLHRAPSPTPPSYHLHPVAIRDRRRNKARPRSISSQAEPGGRTVLPSSPVKVVNTRENKTRQKAAGKVRIKGPTNSIPVIDNHAKTCTSLLQKFEAACSLLRFVSTNLTTFCISAGKFSTEKVRRSGTGVAGWDERTRKLQEKVTSSLFATVEDIFFPLFSFSAFFFLSVFTGHGCGGSTGLQYWLVGANALSFLFIFEFPGLDVTAGDVPLTKTTKHKLE